MNYNQLFIDGQWVPGSSGHTIDVLNPWSEEVIAQVPRGTEEDVNKAVAAARRAFGGWAATPMAERIEIVSAALADFESKRALLIDLEIDELGQPAAWTEAKHVQMPYDRIASYLKIASEYAFETPLSTGVIRREPIGVVGALTPWNYPLGQVVQKVIPAILTGNTVILKPSQHTPLSAYHLVESLAKAGLPAGVLNLVTGAGGEVGNALCLHPQVDMISFTGSTASGREVGRNALSTIKKFALELGGKSPYLCLPGTDYSKAAKAVAASAFSNSGQTCVAFTRFVVPEADLELALAALKEAAKAWIAGDPRDERSTLGPVINAKQYQKVCDLVASGLADGAKIVIGEAPDHAASHHVVSPIVFADVRSDMRIVSEEIFGPVLVVQTYKNVEEGIAIANDTPYGLGAAVAGPAEEALEAAKALRAGQVFVNDGVRDIMGPFGGYKESGIGREGGVIGFEEYLEIKALFA